MTDASDAFQANVAPVVSRWAAARGLYAERTQTALILAWLAWRKTGGRFSGSAYARYAVRQAMAGREMPGLLERRRGCKAVRERMVPSGDMAGLAERRPGPERTAAEREHFARFLAALRGNLRTFCQEAAQTRRTLDVARKLGLSPGRVSQLRREAMEVYRQAE